MAASRSYWLRIVVACAWAIGLAATAGKEADGVEREALARRLGELDARLLATPDGARPEERLGRELQRRLREAGRQSSERWRRVETAADWQALRNPALDALRRSLGRFPAPPAELRRRITRTRTGDGYAVDCVLIESLPGYWIAADLYRPDRTPDSAPALIVSHAHHTGKTHGELQDMGMTWARLGCYVLVPDHPGHGERREHPFRSASDYRREYRASRQDYYFRYDLAVQLQWAGGSLIGQMAWDFSRGVDYLKSLPGVDERRIGILGGVAGGGDPAAVAAALDERITLAAPFNFGGPQPETRYPLPDDAEESFNYTGSGGWESTRNLAGSASGGFLPWVIVGGIAPRRLIYGHEFSWDRPRDPVWKRLEKIYSLYGDSDGPAAAHGRGVLQGRPPEATHCTHIGAEHRVGVHAALARWWQLPDGAAREFSDRLPPEALWSWTDEARAELQPKLRRELLESEVDGAAGARRAVLKTMTPDDRRRTLVDAWSSLAGPATPPPPEDREPFSARPDAPESLGAAVYQAVLSSDDAVGVPTLLLAPPGVERPPVVIAFSAAGKQRLLERRGELLAGLLEQGVAVCLPDLCGTGETRVGDGRDRTSGATSASSSELMLGTPRIGRQVRELRSVVAALRRSARTDGRRIALWAGSLTEPNAADAEFRAPHGVDGRPREAEPAAALTALVVAAAEGDLRAVAVDRPVAELRDVLRHPWVYLPYDALLPGLLLAGDMTDFASAVAPTPLRAADPVDALNRRLDAPAARALWEEAAAAYRRAGVEERFERPTEAAANDRAAVEWLAARLRPGA